MRSVPVSQADHIGELSTLLAVVRRRASLVVQRHLDVLEDRVLCDQVERLEYKTDLVGP